MPFGPQVLYHVHFLTLVLTISLLQRKVRGQKGNRNLPCRSPGLECLILDAQYPCEMATTMYSPFPGPCQSPLALQSSLARVRKNDAKLAYGWCPPSTMLIQIRREKNKVLQPWVFSVK